MNNTRKMSLNILFSTMAQVVLLISRFVVRRYFLTYFGVEILGINSTLTSVISTLSLAELGFQTAVVYNLYKPLVNNDYATVGKIVYAFKRIYQYVAIIVFSIGILLLPFLHYIFTGIEMSAIVYTMYILLLINTTVSYLLSYNRTILYADRQQYIYNSIDLGVTILTAVLQLITIICLKSIVAYLIATIFQTIMSNSIVWWIVKQKYSYITKRIVKPDKEIFRMIWKDTKDIFAGKIAGYVHGTTDNLVISAFVSTALVGCLANYTQLTSALKTLLSSLLNPIVPLIGNQMAKDSNDDRNIHLFKVNSFFRYLLAQICIIPFLILGQQFISVWVGEEYQLSGIALVLICIDLYIHFVHSACCDFISAAGFFHQERNIEIIGAVINLGSSIILANTIGIEGALIGTVLSQIYFWVSRSKLVFRKCFSNYRGENKKYYVKNIIWLIVFILIVCIAKEISKYIFTGSIVVNFIVITVLCEILIMLVDVLIYSFMDEREYIKMIFEIILKKLR